MGVRDRTRQEQQRQAAAAATRYEETSERRRQTRRQLEAGVPFPDSPEALAARVARLLERQAVPAAMVVEAVRSEPLDTSAAFERILGVSKELQAWSFLPRGARAARSVARISVCERGRALPVGTGFLVSPSLLMTNHHVLPDADTARTCFLEFDAQVTVDNTPQLPVRLDFDPDTLFLADKRLDFALVMVAPGPDGTPPGQTFGWHRLSARLGKLVIGEPVNVIGHPMGRLKEIAVRDNALEARLDDFAQYRTDTEPGNSGSPVFNDQWEVVALHHSGVPKTDGQGRVLRRDGQVWQPGDGQDAVDWTSNEGVRISSILRHLASLPVTPAQRALLAEMGPESGLDTTTASNPPPTTSPTATDTSGPAPVPAPASVPARVTTEAAPARTGLRARDGAFGGRRHLLFLHGRSQQGKDPELLRRDWAAGLNQGLLRAGQPPVDPADIWFPFYGNRLMDALAEHEAIPLAAPLDTDDPVTPAAAVPTAPTARAVYEELLTEAATTWHLPSPTQPGPERIGLDPAVGALMRRLGWLAARSDLDTWTISLIFRDVATYLDDRRVRDEVLSCVLETVPDTGEIVLVSHSLGTIVGMDLLTRLPPGIEAVHLTTAGSPLGMDSAYGRLLCGGPRAPEKVTDWLNVWCPTDAVAIGCPLADDWGSGPTVAPTDLAVLNARERSHNIAEYLAHADAAHSIGSRLAS
ncbi:serine protease [Streptomyces sp. NPDC006134]|uniref:serine protease n=1 Tax=Streptomyces sp. NPDC006134 TaxID=3154467 RepID=UPI0033E9786E